MSSPEESVAPTILSGSSLRSKPLSLSPVLGTFFSFLVSSFRLSPGLALDSFLLLSNSWKWKSINERLVFRSRDTSRPIRAPYLDEVGAVEVIGGLPRVVVVIVSPPLEEIFNLTIHIYVPTVLLLEYKLLCRIFPLSCPALSPQQNLRRRPSFSDKFTAVIGVAF